MEESTHPEHYKVGSMDVIAFCHHHDLSFGRGNIIKYVTRAGKKKSNNPMKELEDLKKAMVYLEREIARLNSIDSRDVGGLIDKEKEEEALQQLIERVQFESESESDINIRYSFICSKRESLGLQLLSREEFENKILESLKDRHIQRKFSLFLKNVGGSFDEYVTESFI